MHSIRKRCIAFLTVTVTGLMMFAGCVSRGITGNDWILMQESHLSDLEMFADNMDEVFSLYVMGAIGTTDFLTEIALLREEYLIIDSIYEAEKQEYPILPESNSYAAQKGSESMERVRDILASILNSAIVNGIPLSPEEAAYMYMAYKEELANNLAIYMTAAQYIKAAEEKGNGSYVN